MVGRTHPTTWGDAVRRGGGRPNSHGQRYKIEARLLHIAYCVLRVYDSACANKLHTLPVCWSTGIRDNTPEGGGFRFCMFFGFCPSQNVGVNRIIGVGRNDGLARMMEMIAMENV